MFVWCFFVVDVTGMVVDEGYYRGATVVEAISVKLFEMSMPQPVMMKLLICYFDSLNGAIF